MVENNNLTPQIRDALDELSSYPSAVDVNVIESDSTDWVAVTSIWVILLPRKYVKAGITATGVKDAELITWYFPVSYPSYAPTIYLRSDFPTNLPHINPHSNGDLVPPCVSDIPLSELMHSEGFAGVIDAVNAWLVNAVSNELHDPIQGWEPIRRDDSFGSIIADTYSIREDIIKTKKSVLFYQSYFMNIGDRFVYGSIDKKLKGCANTALNSIRVATSSNGVKSTPIVLFSSPNTVDNYFCETVNDLNSFISICGKCGLSDIVTLRLKYIAERVVKSKHAHHQLVVNDFFMILAVKRPYPLMGKLSDIELLAYRVKANIDSTGKFKLDSPCFPISIQETCNRVLLKAVSGFDTEAEIPMTMIGCGSLGSKLILHLAKTGNYRFQLIDNDMLSMHNNARHALIETSFDRLCKAKAQLLDEKLKSLGLTSIAIDKDFRAIDKTKTFNFHQQGGYVVDSTASLAVRHELSHMDTAISCRLVQTYLLNTAQLGVIAVEGEKRNPRIDDLNALLYQTGINDNHIGNSVYNFDGPQRQQFADGCGSFTTKMNDIDISLPSTAIASKLHTMCTRDVQPSTGELLLCNVDNDDGINWTHTALSETLIYKATEDYPWSIRVLAHIAKEIRTNAFAYSGKENGGVLLGQFDSFSKTIHISGLVNAPPDSKRSATRFVLGTEGLEDTIVDIVKRSEGRITFFGTWHSHLSDEPPSSLDKDTLEKLQTQTTLPVVMLVYTGGRIERIVQ